MKSLIRFSLVHNVRSLHTCRPVLYPSIFSGKLQTPAEKHITGEGSNEGLPSKASGIINSILHGSKQAKDEDHQTYSKLLARGKYVHELQKHCVKPERVDDYIALISEYFPRIANDPENQIHLTGSWQTQIGDLDSFVHIWEFKGYTGYHKTMDRLDRDQSYQNFEKQLRPMLRSRDNQICLEFAFWASSPPKTTGGVYELRSYLLRPGNLLEWETNWRKGLECRRQFCEPVGAWFSQLGALNYVHHMWCYPDLENRKITREQAWKVDGWATTVYNTVRLIDTMNASIMKPLPFSPLK
ncbi:uncharacterized protein VTP21DRAFT_10172 [Calcarisporiella thermophila]|uniref:uncharacterized protein n=1 Tax=Calcarisporiella thermophila TaxID=911321 RepID=UPI00374389B1